MRVYLEGLLPQEARPAVEFSGYVEPEQVCARLADAAVCVFPSRWDGFGIACAEAMAAAKPVIVSEQLREVVAHGATGWSVTPDSPEALANAICNLLADAELRDRLGRAARKHAREHFHPVAVAAETLTTYTGALFAEPEKAHEVSV